MHFTRALALVLKKTSFRVHTYGSGMPARAQPVLGSCSSSTPFLPESAEKNLTYEAVQVFEKVRVGAESRERLEQPLVSP